MTFVPRRSPNLEKLTEETIENWWDINSEIYQAVSFIGVKDVDYGLFLPSEHKLRLLDSVKSKRILDLGCGGGQNSIVLARHGAFVTALDIFGAQLSYAKKI